MVKESKECALCRDLIYEDNSGQIEYRDAIFCSESCYTEATGKTVKSVPLEVVSEDENGNIEYKTTCPECGRVNHQNEGYSVVFADGKSILYCAHCGSPFRYIEE